MFVGTENVVKTDGSVFALLIQKKFRFIRVLLFSKKTKPVKPSTALLLDLMKQSILNAIVMPGFHKAQKIPFACNMMLVNTENKANN